MTRERALPFGGHAARLPPTMRISRIGTSYKIRLDRSHVSWRETPPPLKRACTCAVGPIDALFALRTMNVRFRFFSCLVFAALLGPAGAARAATAHAPSNWVLGIQNGLVQENAVAVDNASQSLADFIGNATGHRVIWEGHFTAELAGSAAQGQAYDFAFVKPANLTAALLSKGWRLVAVAKSPVEFGTDLIAQPCPGKPGQVLLGGPTLAVLGVEQNIPQTCVPPSGVWSSPAAIILAPAKGSLVDKVAQKIWREHAAAMPGHYAYAKYQNAVTGFMQSTHVAVIGAVTPIFSRIWRAQGGVVLAHQSMPFWALLAAPRVPAASIRSVRTALLSTQSESVDKALHIPGWEAGSPEPYAAFMQWLRKKS